jgi:hypothetical protein
MKLGMTCQDYKRLIGESYSDKGTSLVEAKTVWAKHKVWGKPSGSPTKYAKPTGWKKPMSYSGLAHSPEHKASMSTGVLDLGLVDPADSTATNEALKKSVFRNLIRLLVQTQGMAKISDPEWVLKELFPGGLIKTELAAELSKALSDLFDSPVKATVSTSQNIKGGFGWVVAAPDLQDLLGDQQTESWDEAVELYLSEI